MSMSTGSQPLADTAQDSAGHPPRIRVDVHQNWRFFVEYKWPRPPESKYKSWFEKNFFSYMGKFVVYWFKVNIVGFFSHASLLAVSGHPSESNTVGAKWELTFGDEEEEGVEGPKSITSVTSYFSSKKIDNENIPDGWQELLEEEGYEFETDYYNDKRVYREVGHVHASMNDIHAEGECLPYAIYAFAIVHSDSFVGFR